MPRLNIKSTKAAFVKELKKQGKTVDEHYPKNEGFHANKAIIALLEVAKELEIEIKPEEYK